MKKYFVSLLAAISLAVLSGCDVTTSSASGTLKVYNYSGSTIYYLYVSPCTSSSWGGDQLGSSVISNGSSFTLTSIPAGCYDLKAALSGGTTLATEYSVTISSGSTRYWSVYSGYGTIASLGDNVTKTPLTTNEPKGSVRINSTDVGIAALGDVFIERGESQTDAASGAYQQ